MIIKRALLEAALPATDTKDSRYFLQAVRASTVPTSDGKPAHVRVESTNGHVAFRLTDTSPFPATDFPCGKGNTPADVVDRHAPTLIPATTVKAAIKVMPKRSTIPILEAVQVAEPTEPDGAPRLIATDLTQRSEAPLHEQDRTFPDLDHVWPKHTAETGVRVGLSYDVLKTLLDAMRPTKVGEAVVTLTLPVLKAGAVLDTAIVASWQCQDAITAEAILMPCRI